MLRGGFLYVALIIHNIFKYVAGFLWAFWGDPPTREKNKGFYFLKRTLEGANGKTLEGLNTHTILFGHILGKVCRDKSLNDFRIVERALHLAIDRLHVLRGLRRRGHHGSDGLADGLADRLADCLALARRHTCRDGMSESKHARLVQSSIKRDGVLAIARMTMSFLGGTGSFERSRGIKPCTLLISGYDISTQLSLELEGDACGARHATGHHADGAAHLAQRHLIQEILHVGRSRGNNANDSDVKSAQLRDGAAKFRADEQVQHIEAQELDHGDAVSCLKTADLFAWDALDEELQEIEVSVARNHRCMVETVAVVHTSAVAQEMSKHHILIVGSVLDQIDPIRVVVDGFHLAESVNLAERVDLTERLGFCGTSTACRLVVERHGFSREKGWFEGRIQP